MPNPPVTLDMSKAQPIKLDMSKAQPIQGAPASPDSSSSASEPGLISQGIDAVKGVFSGAAKALGHSATPILKAGDAMGVGVTRDDVQQMGIDPDSEQGQRMLQATEQANTPAAKQARQANFADATTPHGAAEGTGATIENIAEFIMGDASLKSLSLGAKMKAVAPVMEMLEKFPILQKAVVTGLRQGAVGTMQGLAHGEDPTQALTEGAIAGFTGGATEGAGAKVKQAVNAVKPGTTTIAGETMPKLASQADGASKAARNAASISNEPTIAKAQQAGSKKAVGNIAQKAAQDAIDQVNETRVPTTTTTEIPGRSSAAAQNAKRQVGSMAATVPGRVMAADPLAEQIGTQAATIPDSVMRPISMESTKAPRFEPATAGNVTSFGEAADAVRDAARPVYDQLNELSGGHFNELKNGMKQARQAMFKATSKEAYQAAAGDYDKAEKALNGLFEQHSDQIGKSDLTAAKKAWAQSITLDKVHDAIEGAFNRVPENISARTGVPRAISGGRLRARLGSVIEKEGQDSIENVIGKDGVDNLYRIADLLDKPATGDKARTVIENVAKYLGRKTVASAAGAAVGTAVGIGPAAGAAAGATLHESANAIMHKAATNPRVANLIITAVERGVKPEFYAPLISSAFRNADALTE